LQRLDVRHRRQRGAPTRPRRKADQSEDDRAYGGVWSRVALA
jgi:hypothetical protein